MILYLNNFRGFTKTFIPFESVNFLVGENSTGKSTVISVLELLSKTSFWMSPQLSSGEYHLGPFQEIVNQLSSDKSFFQIGAEYKAISVFNPKSDSITIRILETFKDKDGSIVLEAIRFSFGDSTYYCSIAEDRKIVVSIRTRFFSTFKDWVCSDTPMRVKVLDYGFYDSIWIPSLIKFVMDSYNSDSDNQYLILLPTELSNFTSFSPIRAEAHRIYESFSQAYSPQGEHIPVVLNKLMHSNSSIDKAIVEKLCGFGKNSKLFDTISTPRFGKATDSPFTVSIGYEDVSVNLTNVGYGVIQSLPLVVEILKSSSCAFSIQQPEVHLHPKAQAAFGDFLYESATQSRNTFFCETHSDFIINRFRYALNGGLQKIKSQVLFFTRDNLGTHVTQIPIDENGHFANIPKEYMSFFIDEELKMLEF